MLKRFVGDGGEQERTMAIGGGRGIRTLDTVARIHAFQACAFSRSATPPASPDVGSARTIVNAAGLTTAHRWAQSPGTAVPLGSEAGHSKTK